MRRVALWILGIAGGLVALVFVAVAIAIWAIDANRFVEPVQARVKAATGRDLAIKGGIRIAPSLTPEVVLSDVSIANAPWGSAPALASAKRIEAQIALIPLLSGRIEVLRIELVEPTIALETDARGQANWEFAAAAPAGTPPTAATASPPAPTPFGVGNVAIRAGKLSYRDGKSGKVTQAAIESFTLQARDPNAPVQAEFRGTIDDIPVAVAGQLGSPAALLARRWPYPIDLAGEVAGKKSSLGAKLSIDGATNTFDALTIVHAGTSLKGKVAIATGGARPKLIVDATMPALDAATPASGGASTPGTKVTPPPRSAFVFPDTPVPLGALAALDADVKLAIGTLTLRPGLPLQQTELRFTLQNSKLDAPALQAHLFGGTVNARLAVDASRADAPAVSAHVNASGIDLGPLLAAAGIKREVKGAKLALVADIATRGVSPRAWVSAANGNVLATIGRGTLTGASADHALPIEALLDAINPFRRADPSTEIVCAVVRLPLAGGVARIDRSIAGETTKLDMAASGTLDFRTESLDLSFRPRVRQGIPIDLPQIAELVRLRGTFADPRVSVDAMASAATVARIGAAVGTGGLSALGEALLQQGEKGGPSVCEVALRGGAATRAASDKGAAPTPSPQHSLGKSIQRLFGR